MKILTRYNIIKSTKTNYIISLKGFSLLVKPCRPKMEHIAMVRDGNTGEYGNGYHTIAVTALTPEHHTSKFVPHAIADCLFAFCAKSKQVIADMLCKKLKPLRLSLLPCDALNLVGRKNEESLNNLHIDFDKKRW